MREKKAKVNHVVMLPCLNYNEKDSSCSWMRPAAAAADANLAVFKSRYTYSHTQAN